MEVLVHIYQFCSHFCMKISGVWMFLWIFLRTNFLVGLLETPSIMSVTFWSIRYVMQFHLSCDMFSLNYRATNKTQKETQKKAFSKPRTMSNERCLLQKYEMAGSNKSWQETNPLGYCWFTRRGCSLVWQVDWPLIHTFYLFSRKSCDWMNEWIS